MTSSRYSRNADSSVVRLAPLYSGLAHGFRMLSALVILKLIAVYVGPDGLAKLGFFMSLASILAVFSGGGITNAVIKFVAEYRDSPIRVVRFLGSAVLYGSTFSVALLVVSIAFAVPLANLVFSNTEFWWMMPVFGLSQIFTFVGVVTLSTANGLGRQDVFAAITVAAYSGSMLISYGLISSMGIAGGALALALVTASVGFVSCVVISRSRLLRVVRLRYDCYAFSKLFKFTLIAISAALFFPVTEILLRSQIITTLGFDTAGYWQGLVRLSSAYIGFFSVFLATTFMPRLSATVDLSLCRRLVLRQILTVGAVFLLCAVVIFLLREAIILLVFSTEFLPIIDVIAWQLLGDLLRISSFVVGFLLVSKAATKLYIGAEFIQFAIYFALTSTIIRFGGSLDAIAQGYAISYGVYLAIMLGLLFWYTRERKA